MYNLQSDSLIALCQETPKGKKKMQGDGKGERLREGKNGEEQVKEEAEGSGNGGHHMQNSASVGLQHVFGNSVVVICCVI